MNENPGIGEKAGNIIRSATAQAAGIGTETTSTILKKLHVINRAEIEAGSIALQRGLSAAARDFGQHLISDHERMDREITQVARNFNVDLRDELSEESVRHLREKLEDVASNLREADPKEFDRIFGDSMYKAHKEAIAMTQNAEDDVSSDEVGQLLRSTVAALQHHVQLAERVQAQAQ
ncbi:MAG TPA: DUF4142 domain-containing protein [Oligoflexus sp.]|uniref:DUF4142 domain-containing protein n=1 Tax=Oligoflexus sp. TaxID=1971216 RepID=UPI002D7FF7ED|nr:DUF4142 domain-containing protein [Oligoflexus sp.]HET9241283.1 DUF4142 domain-containing protein [Oligoflexus sp.]